MFTRRHGDESTAGRAGGPLRWILVGVAALGLLGVAGCGGDDSGSGGDGEKSALEGLSATDVLTKSRDAAKAAKSVKVTGEIIDGQNTTKLDVTLTAANGGSGTVSQNDATFELILIGKDIYLKADEKTWSTIGASPNPGVAKLIGDKYVKASADNPSFASLAGVLSLPDFVDGVLTPEDTPTRAEGKDVDGVPTVALKSGEADGGVLYIADRGAPYPLLLEGPKGEGQVAFTDWDKAVTFDPPPADQVLDFSELAK